MKEIAIFPAHGSYTLGLAFTRDSRRLISSGMDNVAHIWSAPNWELENTLEGHENSLNSFQLSPDESRIVTGSSDNTVRLWSFPDGDLLHTVQDRKKTVSSVTFAPDGEAFAAGSYGGRASVWSLSGEALAGFKASNKNLGSVLYTGDGQTLVTSGLGDDIHVWRLPAAELLTTLTGHKVAVRSLALLDGGDTLLSLGYEGTIRLWDTGAWEEKAVVNLEGKETRGIVPSPDGRFAGLLQESQVQIRTTSDWQVTATLPVSTKVVNGLAFSGDGRWLALGGADGKIRIWSTGESE